jgi:hypothetical protein
MMLDLSQWVWLYPGLGEDYVAGAVDATVLETQWQAFHDYVGVGLGLYLATLFNAVWALGAGWLMVTAGRFARWIGATGIAAGVLFLASIAPGASFSVYSALNSLGFVAWLVWLLGTAWVLLTDPRPALHEVWTGTLAGGLRGLGSTTPLTRG